MDFKAITSIIIFATILGAVLAKSDKIGYKDKDVMRTSIIFDKKTPDVFYCPMQKPSAMKHNLIVKSRPLHKLCEYEGNPLPPEYKSDCYNDVDESAYACKEKYRIMKRFA